MSAVAAEHAICAWKVYTHAGPGWYLDDHDPTVPQVGERFLTHVEALGVNVVAVHKGLSGGSAIRLAGRHRPGRRQPSRTSSFVVYHSGYESSYREVEFEAERRRRRPLDRIGAGGRHRAGRQRLRRARLDVAGRDGRPRPGRALLGKLLRRSRRGQHRVGHRQHLVRLAAGPDRRLPSVRDHTRVPGALRLSRADAERKAKILGLNALRVFGIDQPGRPRAPRPSKASPAPRVRWRTVARPCVTTRHRRRRSCVTTRGWSSEANTRASAGGRVPHHRRVLLGVHLLERHDLTDGDHDRYCGRGLSSRHGYRYRVTSPGFGSASEWLRDSAHGVRSDR